MRVAAGVPLMTVSRVYGGYLGVNMVPWCLVCEERDGLFKGSRASARLPMRLSILDTAWPTLTPVCPARGLIGGRIESEPPLNTGRPRRPAEPRTGPEGGNPAEGC